MTNTPEVGVIYERGELFYGWQIDIDNYKYKTDVYPVTAKTGDPTWRYNGFQVDCSCGMKQTNSMYLGFGLSEGAKQFADKHFKDHIKGLK